MRFSTQTMHQLKHIQALLDQLQSEEEPRALLLPDAPDPGGSIIVFPGAFNPPTNAHLALMQQARLHALTQKQVEKDDPRSPRLYAAISKLTVDKERVERPLLVDRVLLLSAVLQAHLPWAGILLFNCGLYVEQAQAVRTSFSVVQRLFFLIGYDKIVQIFDPRYYQERDTALDKLFSLADILVAPRAGYGLDALTNLLEKPQNHRFAPFIHALPFDDAYRDISSSHVRQYKEQLSAEVPPEVQDFMLKTRAYLPPLLLQDGQEVDVYAERAQALQQLLKQENA